MIRAAPAINIYAPRGKIANFNSHLSSSATSRDVSGTEVSRFGRDIYQVTTMRAGTMQRGTMRREGDYGATADLGLIRELRIFSFFLDEL